MTKQSFQISKKIIVNVTYSKVHVIPKTQMFDFWKNDPVTCTLLDVSSAEFISLLSEAIPTQAIILIF